MENQQTTQNQQTVQNQQIKNDSIDIDAYMFENLKKIDIEKYKELRYGDAEASIILPGCEKELTEFIEELSKNPTVLKDLTDEDKLFISDIMDIMSDPENMLSVPSVKNIGCRDNIENYQPELKVNGKTLKMKTLRTKLKPNDTTSIKLALKEAVGIGANVHVPLWHSGFWVTLEPSMDEEKINLQLELANEINRIGRKTHGLAYSNYSVMFYRTLVDYIRNKIIATSFAVPEDKDIFDYIKLQDLNILVWGLLQTMYPRGFNYVIACKNTIKLNESNLPKCNFKADVKLDLSKMLWTDTSILTNDHKAQMLKRTNRSVSEEEVLKYQETLPVNDGDVINLQLSEYDMNISINIQSPTVNEYLLAGEGFIEELRNKVNELMQSGAINGKIIEKEEDAEVILLNTVILRIYLHYITSITVNGKVIDTYLDKQEIIDIISNNKKYKKMVLDKILNYIDNSLMAIIGMPDYTCPVCKENQSETENGSFRSFISIDVLSYFFILLAYQYQKALERSGIE